MRQMTSENSGAARPAYKAAARRSLVRNRDGVAAIEFAMLAVPFLALLFVVLNTALVFFAQQTLQTATTQAARLILTGQAQQQNMSALQFQQAVCKNATAMFNCGGIAVSVQTFASFTAIAMTNPLQNGKLNTSNLPYSLGSSGDIEVVQVFYQWPLFATMLGPLAADTHDLLIATAAFRNEPY
jgi:Flp pilus assembly protein TadG